MKYKEAFERRLKKLLKDPEISNKNKILFEKIFEKWLKKLKRRRGASSNDEANYKTLCSMTSKFKNITTWLENKDWEDITEEDFKKMFNDLEDNKLLKSNGKPHEDKRTYYDRIFLSKPFEIAGKSEIARKVMNDEEYCRNNGNEEVRFFDGNEYPKIVDTAIKTEHKAFLQLSWDIGENVFTIIQLQKKKFKRQVDPENHQPEYLVNLMDKSILKRSRTARTEPTIHSKTVELLDMILKDKKEEDLVFGFGQKMAEKIFRRCVKITKLKNNNGTTPTLKDIRSSMACYLLDQGWTTDEIRQRLGHKPSSKVLDKYVSYKALNRKSIKKKVNNHKIGELTAKIEEFEQREKLLLQRLERVMQEVADIKKSV